MSLNLKGIGNSLLSMAEQAVMKGLTNGMTGGLPGLGGADALKTAASAVTGATGGSNPITAALQKAWHTDTGSFG
jgi:hypothetical protein